MLEAASIAEALSGASSSDDEEQGLTAGQLMGAEDLIAALHPGYDRGDPKASKVARAVEQIVRSTMQKIEANDD